MNVARSVMISEELSATMVIDHEGAFRVRWAPAPPRALSREQLEVYMRTRNLLVREILGLRGDLVLSAYTEARWK